MVLFFPIFRLLYKVLHSPRAENSLQLCGEMDAFSRTSGTGNYQNIKHFRKEIFFSGQLSKIHMVNSLTRIKSN